MVHAYLDRHQPSIVEPSKLLIIGSRGFIGRHFCRHFPAAKGLDRSQLDLCHPTLKGIQGPFQYALITAGIGNPKACAADPSLSYACNVKGTLQLGKELLKSDILPIFFSSDYVFNDALAKSPLNIYGEQKLELENEAIQLGGLVIRLSRVYGLEKRDGTLFDEMVQTLIKGEDLKVAYDQIFAPIFVGDVVRRVISLLQENRRGIETVAGPQYASRLEMAEHVAQQLGADKRRIQRISLDELDDGIKRPKTLSLTGNFPALTWREGIDTMVAQWRPLAYAQ